MNNTSFWRKPRPFWPSLSLLVAFSAIVLLIIFSLLNISSPEKVNINEKPGVDSLKAAPLAQGKQSFDVITADSLTFKIIQVDVDPLDVKRGKIQTITVLVEDVGNNPITEENEVKATVYQDNTSAPVSFLLKEAGGAATSTITTWQGSWTCGDSHNLTYMINIVAERTGGKHSIDLSFR